MEKTIQEVAKEMYENMETKTRTNGEHFIACKKDISWQRDIILDAHGDKLPDDQVYHFIHDALATLTDSEEGSEDEAIYEMESDPYTFDLTKWLHSRADRVYYLTDAIENGAKDGFQALSMAQKAEMDEVGLAILRGIKEYIKA